MRSGEEVLCKAKAALVFVDSVMQPRALPEQFRATVTQFEELDSE